MHVCTRSWCTTTSDLQSNTNSHTAVHLVTIVFFVPSLFFVWLTGGIEDKFYTAMQCSFCVCCSIVFVGRNRISMHQKRVCTSPLPHYNLSHPEVNKHNM
jgi:hypothetical protein